MLELPLLLLLLLLLPLSPTPTFANPLPQAPGYSKVITMPMDFTTMRRNLNAGMYSSWESLQSDLELMFQVAVKHLLF